MRFVNSTQRALFRHPNEAFLYDLDGTLTGTGVVETYTMGGGIRGSSFVGTSVLRPMCTPTNMSLGGSGGSICTGLIFRRTWFLIAIPSLWIGNALCVRTPNTSIMNLCQTLEPQCNCLPYLDTPEFDGNVFLSAEGARYHLQVAQPLYYLEQIVLKDLRISPIRRI